MAVFIKNFPPSIGNAVTSGGQHYMMINSYKQVNAVTTGETILSSIGLYIPPAALTTKFTGDYESKDGAATTAKMTEAAFVSAGKALLEKATQAVIATVDKGGFMSAQGKAPNNHVALLYKGPGSFRDHTFAFKFFPKNKPESDLVKDIISEFKNGMLPTMGFGDGSVLNSSFFKAPRHHKIKFFNGAGENPYLFEIGTSVITDMSVNYDPQSLVGFHSDGSPVQIDMSLTFKEIELQVSKDKLTGPARTQMAASEFQTQMARATDVTRNSSGSRQNRERDF
jgi:hypothetical protein|tara:strand:- start:69 stop:914 length:846 start_codon:yes stop_codon:yes gene_type:complete